jgi:hypothetical protein
MRAMPPVAASSVLSAPLRRDRVLAVTIDALWGLGAVFFAAMVAFTWLFVRTGWGRYDVESIDSIAAAALIAAAIPAWLAWLSIGLRQDRATFGQRSRQLTVAAEGARRPAPELLRLAVHPLGLAGWGWLTILFALLTVPVLPLLFAAITGTIALMGIVSAVLILRDPGTRGLHDRIAGTRLARREEPAA